MFLMLTIGLLQKSLILVQFAGFLMAIVGIYIFINGLMGHSLVWFNSGEADAWIFYSAFILMGTGMYYLLYPFFNAKVMNI